MRLSLDLDTPRLMISAAVGGGAILAHPQLQLAFAVLLAALASVAVDVLKALGRWAVHRLTRDIPKLADTPADPVASGDENPPPDDGHSGSSRHPERETGEARKRDARTPVNGASGQGGKVGP
jgi:hypothetical protein